MTKYWLKIVVPGIIVSHEGFTTLAKTREYLKVLYQTATGLRFNPAWTLPLSKITRRKIVAENKLAVLLGAEGFHVYISTKIFPSGGYNVANEPQK